MNRGGQSMTGEDQYALFEFDDATSEVDEDVVPSESTSDEQSDGAEEISTAQPAEDEGDTTNPPPWESLPVGVEADEHALIVTAAGTYTPSGRELTGPVDSVEKLDKLVRWAALKPLGAPPQVWIVGQGACEALGWVIDPGNEEDFDDMEALRTRAASELTAVLQAALTPML
ncbi:MAG: hypothetical protein EOO27_23015, partial [Comamonadaceae bacterium]